MAGIRLLLFLALFSSGILVISSLTDSNDAAALQGLKNVWKNTPPSWGHSEDPCGAPWDGVTCNDSRVTALKLSSMGLVGELGGDIGGLTELISLDLSSNRGLTGSLSPSLGDLRKLNILILLGCSFSGDIPDELGNLAELSFLALNSNKLSGKIPPSLGKLSKLYWLDLAENQLTGPLPISTSSTAGLDRLLKAKHFHFNKNRLSGTIPAKLFSSEMVLIHILFDGNQLYGSIPSTLGLVQTVEVLRLDRNALTGEVPSNLSNLIRVNDLNLAYNNLTGALPNLTQLKDLHYVDLSNNSFDPSKAPAWFSTLPSLTTLIMEYGSLEGAVPQELFSLPQIQQVKLKNNTFSDTLNMGKNIGPQLQLVDLQNNHIPLITLPSGYTKELILTGNPVCTADESNADFCLLQPQPTKNYSTSLANCGTSWAPSGNDSGGAPQLKGARWFSYDELKKCTNHFAESNGIGSGGYGKVYRGMLSDGQVVAIKRAQQGSMQGGHEFKTEIELLSRVHHKNLVGLMGFCFEQGEQMLVYEFLPNGSLRESLSGKSGIYLDWKRRLRIALGSARGLAYLHELANPPIIHRDVKSANILLDENLTAKVADFGLSKLISDGSKGHVSTQVKGTMGYLDPEYYMTQQLTEKSDVYSFGVVMLELVTAKQPIEKGKYIVREVLTAMKKNDDEYYGLRNLIDSSIKNITNLIGFGRFLELTMQCVDESAADRPTMSEVVKALETILQNDGLATNATSASSSATDFVASKGASKHPYKDSLPKDNDSFDYSGGYTISAKVEPK
ncbi:hypothetical protein I3843_16G074100 [Carya illinoinensis]|nr:hypothetical protein I3843_16G074100 [Carya illinoinensis]